MLVLYWQVSERRDNGVTQVTSLSTSSPCRIAMKRHLSPIPTVTSWNASSLIPYIDTNIPSNNILSSIPYFVCKTFCKYITKHGAIVHRGLVYPDSMSMYLIHYTLFNSFHFVFLLHSPRYFRRNYNRQPVVE